MTSAPASAFVKDVFAAIPDLVAAYHSYPHEVLRADLLRYLLLWYHGGFYSDMDVFPVLPIRACSALSPIVRPEHDTQHNISLVIGIEIDEPYASPRLMHDWHWSRSYGFIQFSMYAPRRFSPILRRAIARVVAHTKRHHQPQQQHQRQRQHQHQHQHPHQTASLFSFNRGVHYDEKTILEVTGPGVFTDAVLDVLSDTLPPTHRLVNESVNAEALTGAQNLDSGAASGSARSTDGKEGQADRQARVTWAPFHRLQAPLWVDASEIRQYDAGTADGDSRGLFEMGGLGVLPINVWGNGQRHSGAESFRSVHACVNHRFGRTWKKGWWEYIFG